MNVEDSNLEDLIEARLKGNTVEAPADLREQWECAMAGFEAIQYALGETILAPPHDTDDRRPPVLPDDYEIVREIGCGGMGVVYLAHQKSLGRDIAVKVLRPGEAVFTPLVRRFMDEARHLARLRHPNIVAVHDVSKADDEPYFTMDYVAGESLATALRRGPMPPTRALSILQQAASGVEHAHQQGIIHRDLKPANILLDGEGRAFVSDFGLARDVSSDSDLTRTGAIMGTPAYMAPEQARGETALIGEAADVHAMGAILYEMLTGRPPYGDDSPANVLVRLINEEPTPPRRIDRRIPRDLETVCLKALAKSPDKRYPTMRALLEDLRRCEQGEPILARRPGPWRHAARFFQRQWKILAAVALTAALLLAIAPTLFDKSFDELRAWGDERHAAGDHDGAFRVYQRALSKAGRGERREILDNMIRCAREMGNAAAAVDAALLVLEEDPGASFAEYDYLVARAVITKLRAANPNNTIRYSTDENRPLLELAQRRLKIFLDGLGGTEAERDEAKELLQVVQKELNKAWQVVPVTPEKHELPQGDPAQLLATAADENLNSWVRGKASLAAGLQLEKSGKTDEALAAFRQAYELMRTVYPTYSGVTSGLTIKNRETLAPTWECELLAQAHDAVRRLDPQAPDAHRGGIRLRIGGVQLPPEIAIGLKLTLCDPQVKDPDRGFNHPLRTSPSRTVPVMPDQTAFVGVADGKYRLQVLDNHRMVVGEPSRLYKLLELDCDTLPGEIEIAGDIVELSIPARILEEVALLAPERGAPVDLNEQAFQWSEIESAASYRIQWAYQEENAQGTSTMYGLDVITVDKPPLRFGELDDDTIKQLRDRLQRGHTALWHVEAYDANGRKLGESLEDNRPFLVARPLDQAD